MKIKLGIFTGARSDYGLTKKLIRKLINDEVFDVKIYVSGMHLLEKFGHTYEEILNDGFEIYKKIPTYDDNESDKCEELTQTIEKIYRAIYKDELDFGYIVGDRIEAYGAALALHFRKIPILHYAGGQITEGAIDNIYRYNISNLSYLHFTTTNSACERLKQSSLITKSNVYFTGSTAIDSICDFKNNPINIERYIPNLKSKDFALMTFHPVTNCEENISLIMSFCVEKILEQGLQVLITYPNNDDGYEEILKVLDEYRDNESVVIMKNLETDCYYSAIHSSKFVIGNSSSGIIEVPYFDKININIGSRQKGRICDDSVINLAAETYVVNNALNKIKNDNWKALPNQYLYGKGDSCDNIIKIIKNRFYKNGY